ncbi:Bystin-domain-containing protein [Xylariaceae sp. AK1471]|nr:Bystin-domain-containing protein [Xylariaceae sp. AK1471]
MPKATTPKRRALEDEYTAGGILRNRKRKSKSQDEEEQEENFVDSRTTRKILDIGRQLLAEEDAPPPPTTSTSTAFGFDSRYEGDAELYDEDGVWADDDDEIIEHTDVEPEDLETFQKFLPTDFDDPLAPWSTTEATTNPLEEEHGTSTNLADLILARIAAHENSQDSRDMEPVDEGYELSPKVVEVYTKIGGLFLSRYKSGKLPKAFKILPTVPHWEDIIQITNPPNWTPNAVLAATRLFVSSKPAVVRQFLSMILLDHVRDDIAEALYKPAAFMKGILFPLVESGCNLRQAHIISAVLSRVSIPVLHSAAAIKGLCEIAAHEASAGTEGGGAVNIFLRTLLDKRYALPWQTVDALVFHFLRFRSSDPASATEADVMNMGERAATQAKLPVIWHQTFLSFAIRYKNEITEDQRELLLDLLLTHGHNQIGPEIRRELLAGRGRGVVAEPQGPALDGDDTMLIDG